MVTSSEIGVSYYLTELYNEHTLFWRGDQSFCSKSLHYHRNVIITEFLDWIVGIGAPTCGYLNPGLPFKKETW